MARRQFHFHARPHCDDSCGRIERCKSKQRRSPQDRRVYYAAALALFLLIVLVQLARAGNPAYVAGISYFESGLAGQPITWAGGSVSYYTDQGNLSSILPGTAADSFVADAFSRWTSISTVAISSTRSGQLDEDVNGTNVIVNIDTTITLPLDIQPTATHKPIAVVYDSDGKVTDALIGSGASADCFTNSVFGGADAFTTDAHFAHALVILDGKCATTSASLPDLKYRLVRVLGRVLGLGWSQLNRNAITGSPAPTADDIAGFPVMHGQDLSSCVPISKCVTNADQPRLDDRAALSRLYPVTSENLGQFPGKQVFAANTAHIRGSVRFKDADAKPGQPMQGVNVVARWIENGTNQPSGRYAASSVSGFLFSGNAGNAISGYADIFGQPYTRFGSPDTSLEGFFDLAGLEIPSGETGQFQLSVEPIDPLLSQNVGPYAGWQVAPSGSFDPIVLTVGRGDTVEQDIVMDDSAVDPGEIGVVDTFTAPNPLPKTGDWMGSLNGYGDADYFWFSGRADRTLAVEVTTLDENGQSTTQKAQPLIGMWSLEAPEETPPPAYTFSPFNTLTSGMTRLDAQLLASTQFRVGIVDSRGDGRPDFRYHARVLYGDSIFPDRLSVRGSMPLLVEGVGFKPGVTLKVGNAPVALLAVSPNQLVASIPAFSDGLQNVTITDPATGASSALTNALTLGAGPNDSIRLVQGATSGTPVGAEIAYPVRVSVTTADGATAVNGATIQWSATNQAKLGACSGATTCSVSTDESGQAETRVTIGATGITTITAALAPATYTPAKSVQVSINGTSSAKDLVLLTPKVWVANGATIDVPFTARLLANSVPQSGQTLKWQIGIGSGTVTPSSGMTDGAGYSSTTVRVTNLSGDVQGSVCVSPANSPCQTFYIVPVSSSVLKFQPVSGGLQTIQVGQSFQPIVVRVTNSATPPNPVMGVPVTFKSMIFLPDADAPVEVSGDDGSTQHAMKVLLGSSQINPLTDANGLATLVPSTGGFSRPLEIEIVASAGAAAPLQYELPMLPAPSPSPGASTGVARTPGRAKQPVFKMRPARHFINLRTTHAAEPVPPNVYLYSLPISIELERGSVSQNFGAEGEASQGREVAPDIHRTPDALEGSPDKPESPPARNSESMNDRCEQDQFAMELTCHDNLATMRHEKTAQGAGRRTTRRNRAALRAR